MLVSTAGPGYFTPTGMFHIINKCKQVFSRRRNRWMTNWLGFTANGLYGIHSLFNPDYEKYLGQKDSTDCIRVSRADRKWLFK